MKALSLEQTEVTQDSAIKFKGMLKLFAPLMILMSKFSKADPQAEAHAKLKEMAEVEFQMG